jgi:aspartyl-tRNA synthetase
MEMSFMSQSEIIELNENLVCHIFKTVKGIDLPRPFPRLTYAQSMELYGSDKPDTRFDLELVNVSDLVKDSGFKVFSGAIASGGVVKSYQFPAATLSFPTCELNQVATYSKKQREPEQRSCLYSRPRRW